VVVDDAAQGISHVVRGEDLADNTARQILLQRALGLPTPAYLHTPLVLAADGHKLSKQNGAQALDLAQPVAALQAAGPCWACRASKPRRRPPGWPARCPLAEKRMRTPVPGWAGIIRAFNKNPDGEDPR
jgi:glutamyl-Q tRNA(Asp) synthetase